jgi:hypothetical protein
MTAHDPVWEEFKDRAIAVPIDEVASRFNVKLRRTGPDLLGHCPAGCTSHGDGFIVTPRKRIFLCRPSGETGDVIDMVRHAEGLDFAAACEFITGEKRPDRSHDETPEERKAREALKAKRKADAAAREEREARDAERKKRQDEEAIGAVLRRAKPIFGTQAEAYLLGRGTTPLKKLCIDLKFVAELDYANALGIEKGCIGRLRAVPRSILIVRCGSRAVGRGSAVVSPGAKPPRRAGESCGLWSLSCDRDPLSGA